MPATLTIRNRDGDTEARLHIRAHRATVATRDLGGFSDCGVGRVDPRTA